MDGVYTLPVAERLMIVAAVTFTTTVLLFLWRCHSKKLVDAPYVGADAGGTSAMKSKFQTNAASLLREGYKKASHLQFWQYLERF